MSAMCPPIESGYRGRRRIATLEEYYGPYDQKNGTKEKNEQRARKNGATAHVATNMRSKENSKRYERDPEESSNSNGHRSHRQGLLSAKERHARRGSRWSESEATRRFRAQAKQFDTGTRDFNRRSRPSATDLITSIQKRNRAAILQKKNSHLAATAFQIAQHESDARNQITRQIDDFWRMTAYGKAPGAKPDNCVRVIMENFNSLGVFTNGVKINALNKLCRKFNSDILAGCETQVDWRQATDEQQFRNLIGVGMDTRSIVAHNINERMQRNQHGGCAMMAMGRFSAEVVETGVDFCGLGRWCWMRVGSGDKITRIVMAYQPSGSSSSKSAGTTVREQHERYFEARGDLRSAKAIFFEQLIAQLVVWKATDADIILLGDFNENVYSGRIAKRLEQSDLNFSEQCLGCTGTHIPPTFRDGLMPIDAVYATAGIECVNAYILPHKGGIGDHRCFILDFSSASIIGTRFQNIVRCAARRLHCKSSRLVQAYNHELNMICSRHKMYERIYFIYSHVKYLPDGDFAFLINKWDTELTQYKLHSETNCTIYKSCDIEWSPEVGFWLSRRWLLERVRKYVLGKGSPDPRNLIRECLRSHLFDPRLISHSEVMIHIQITQHQLFRLAKDAPKLRRLHLMDLKKEAEEKGDTARASVILEILTREQERKKWRKINHTTRPPRGGAPITLRVQAGTTVKTYTTEQEMFEHTSDHLTQRFRLAHSAPCYGGQLFDDLGFTGDTECARMILEGTYDYPPDTDKWTTKILQEAHITFSQLSGIEIETTITTEDFQNYWRRVDERTSSSFSGITFSHYKAAANHSMLSAMHAAYLTACARKGIPLKRWGVGLTVLLEKIIGNNFVHKLRAICLLEADFNWMNKMIFAKRMIGMALDKKLIPGECFSKRGSNCISAVMTKIFICDESRIHHHDAVFEGCDFADCYDRIAHNVAGISLRAWGVPQPAINILLETMEMMRFFLRTGFGESKQSYGGTHEQRLAGYGQGNAASGPGFTALSSLIVNAYLREGHGAQIYSSYYKRLLLLAAVMYVDDTDLIHWSHIPGCSPEELIAAAQTATYAWGGLAIATGAAMKPEKCYAYFLSYWFDKGRAKLRTISALPTPSSLITMPNGSTAPSHLRVPMPDGTSAPIPTLSNEETSLMLGVHWSPSSGGNVHVNEMAKKGYNWADRMKSRPLPHELAWKSFNHQLQPGMTWGIATVVLPPKKLLEKFQRVYFKCLPSLNVNCHIELPWRLIPERYQGLGLTNFALVSLASKLAFLQRTWGFADVVSRSLMMGYESFMIEVGLYGNTMDYEYKAYSVLATNGTWYKNIWELAHYFKIRLAFQSEYCLGPIRRGDKSLMSEFVRAGYTKADLLSLNIVRMHKMVIHLSDIVRCDGKTIKQSMISASAGISDAHKFPLQRPTPSDIVLWTTALRRISSEFYTLTLPLQEYISTKHSKPTWRLSKNGDILHHNISMNGKEYHDEYTPTIEPLSRQTRSGRRFTHNITRVGYSEHSRFASITHSQSGQVFMHSSIAAATSPLVLLDFEHNLKSDGNDTLWKSLNYDDDGSWILEGMINRSLIISHDGSYMKEVSPWISAAATMIYCNATKKRCKCTWAEYSESAGSYRGEILGGIMTQLILKAAAKGYKGMIPRVGADCDNNGVVTHGNAPHIPLSTNQTQADLLRVFKNLISTQSFKVKYKYVQSHADDSKKWRDCSLKERINIKVDALAKKAFKAAHSTGEFIESTFPNEELWIEMGGRKITGSPRAELEEYWGRATAKKFFNEKKIVLAEYFDTIWWLGYEKAMAGYPKTFRTFVTKQVSGWCGCNSKLSLWEKGVDSKCPQCGCEQENLKHLTRCTDPGRLMQFRQSIECVMDILSEANVDQNLSDIIEAYLLAQGRRTMKECAPSLSPYNRVATAIDNLGWDCFVEGRIPYVLIETVKPMLRRYMPRGSVELWGAKFIKSLVSITHKQWLYRNSDVHHSIDGLSARQHQELTARIQCLLKTNKDSLHERHRHLMEVDFTKLGSGTTIARQVWVANMDMAISVARIAGANTYTQDTLRLLRTPLRKTPARMSKKDIHLSTPSMQIRTPALSQPRTTTPFHTARYSSKSKLPHCYSRKHPNPIPVSQAHSLLPARKHRDARHKNTRQVLLFATPNTDLRPYDKIRAHLHRLHNRIKALDIRE